MHKPAYKMISEASQLPGSRQVGQTPKDALIEVTLVFRPQRTLADPHVAYSRHAPQRRKHLSAEELQAQRAASSEVVCLAEKFARKHGLAITEIALERRSVALTGTADRVARAFGVEFSEREHERGHYRHATGGGLVPGKLGEQLEAVLGLHTRPCGGRPSTRHIVSAKDGPRLPRWDARELAEAYGISSPFDGRGQCIGLVELGGGFHVSDLKKFFSGLRLPVPKVRCVEVRGRKNSPASAAVIRDFLAIVNGQRKLSSMGAAELLAAQSTAEVTMDIELAGAFAPGADIVVYFTSNDEQGIYHAITRALADTVNRPSVLSLSWGEPEPGVSAAYVRSIDEALRDAAHLGITVCASSGDAGAMNNSPDEKPAVNFPASSPHVLGCGGTTVRAQGKVIESEAAWNCSHFGIHGATGGGVSRSYRLPIWQRGWSVPVGPTRMRGRGVPDVAGPADPHCGCQITVGGQCCASAGTSAVAPLWAALVARLNQARGGRCGYITPWLYKISRTSPGSFRAITRGDNGAYHAGPGWNPCTGLGSPVFSELLRALRAPNLAALRKELTRKATAQRARR